MKTLWHSLMENLVKVAALGGNRKKHPGIFNAALSVALVAAICASMLIATPVSAIRLELPDLPATMNTNTTYSFFAQVNIAANELIPLTTSFRLDIDGDTPAWVEFNVNGDITGQSGTAFTGITPVSLPDYGYGSGFADGFGYRPGTGFGNYTSTFGYGYGYDYGYGNNGAASPTPTIAKYQITINTTGFTPGLYTARLQTSVLPGGTKYVSDLYNLTISSAGMPTALIVTPANPEISYVSGHAQDVTFKATAVFADNTTADYTSFATWTSSNTTVADLPLAGVSTFNILTDGATVITASYLSISGNTTLTVLPDTVAPVVTLNHPAAGFVTNSTALTIDGTVDESAATVTAYVTTGAGQTSYPITLTGNAFSQAVTLATGSNEILVKAVDPAGNIGTSGTRTVYVTANNIPIVSIASPAGNYLTNNPTLTVTGTAIGAATVTVRVNAQDYTVTPAAGAFSRIVSLAEGDNIIVAFAYTPGFTDAAHMGSSGVRTVTLDTVVPVINIVSPVADATVGTALVNVAGNIDDPLITIANLTVNGVSQNIPVAGGAFSQEVTLTVGVNTIRVEATDAAGNTGVTSIGVALDLVKPVVTLTSPANYLYTNATSVNVIGTVNHAGITFVTLYLNAIPQTVAVAGGAFSQSAPLMVGINSIRVLATDVAGTTDTGTLTVIRHAVPPVLEIGLSDPTDSVVILVTANEPLKPPANLTVSDGTTTTPVMLTRIGSLNWVGTYSPIAAGVNYTVRVEAANMAGVYGVKTAYFVKESASLTANTPVSYNVANNATLTVQTNATVSGTISITQSAINPSGLVDHPSGAGNAAGLFVEINASPAIRNSLTSLVLKVYYDPAQLPAGTSEASLRLYLWDETLGVWAPVNPSTLGVDAGGHYIQATITHLSKYGVFGTAISTQPSGGNGGNPVSAVTLNGLKTPNGLNVGQNGAVQSAVQIASIDGKFTFDIASGTILHDANGNALAGFTASAVTNPPAAPAGSALLFAYEFGPSGANFSPDITLTMKYDPAALAAGTVEKDLYIAWWDGANWQILASTVDTVNKTVSAKVSHFSTYALMEKNPAPATPPPTKPVATPPPVTPPSPAKFTVSGLAITPNAVKPGEAVEIAVTVNNAGGTADKYSLTIKVNGIASGTKEVSVAPGAGEKVTFSMTQALPGTYTVELAGLTGTFTVSEAAKPDNGVNYTTLITGILVCVGVAAAVLAYFIWRRRHGQVS